MVSPEDARSTAAWIDSPGRTVIVLDPPAAAVPAGRAATISAAARTTVRPRVRRLTAPALVVFLLNMIALLDGTAALRRGPCW
ncbi:hypothetical protein GCM10023328_09150 [Modestobacter marinus]|uniref:Uncharacterized protein n=1 Tax=Modestobacter marinus TaxID=477641 RepID=A0ABQ2FS10_9ACTN|nr:hypothetical protein GCM10011589_00810 [Modestobacter marinus]